MKYLASSSVMRKELEKWAAIQQQKLLIVSIFFWRSGAPLQRSWEGLVRSVLFHTFGQYPELVDQTFPNYSSAHLLGPQTQPFRYSDLKSALERVMFASQSFEYTVCYFIDGLDEYEGQNVEHNWLARQLKTWSQFKQNKVLCAARPHTVFLDVFGESEAAMLSELTRQDIWHFADQRFRNILDGPRHSLALAIAIQ
jgi:hypothetical protein